ncbi:MAG: alpha/beta hydrolase fold domain-containing protein [Alphaproteobacteria bacterium]|nr:alpha/beta hydrolase fold domain-containing protein [Alphaproteobacteria bacterium]
MDGDAPGLDALIVGAGMAGLYNLHTLRQAGFSALVLEAADDVGGTWYWNRYPGARCDIESIDYSYSFDPDLEKDWTWSERYATQPEILRYLQHVADRYDLRRDIRFNTRVKRATWDDVASQWRIETEAGAVITARFYIMATGCLSMPKTPEIAGAERFKGPSYYTSSWPHEGVDFTGKRVAVIGTGSSAVQSIPLIAQQAAQLTVFQRTPAYSIPARNGPVTAEKRSAYDADPKAYREAARWTGAGVPIERPLVGALQVSAAEREAVYEDMWRRGELLRVGGAFADLLSKREANDTLADFIRGKIRSTVKDPETAADLCTQDYPVATKRACLDTNYYETFNLPHVRLVNIRKRPIRTVTETGIEVEGEHIAFDAIVYATGFDAMTGAILALDVEGRGGVTLKDRWAYGPETYLGLMTVGFPNYFMITGPGSPSVLSNMAVSIEQHVEWITQTLRDMRSGGFLTIEPTQTAEEGWKQHASECANLTLFPDAASWYTGANVEGKLRIFLPYVGGVDTYRRACEAVRDQGYLGFALKGPQRTQCNDGVVCRLKPDVDAVLRMMAELNLPPLETMSPTEARAFLALSSAQRPPGPDVGAIVDGEFPGAAGPLAYRLYRPATPGPHRMALYFHGGGWVVGDAASDDPLCRDLCAQSNAIVLSVNYRHGPEDRFPAAHDDALAALNWAAANADALGARGDGIVVVGWSAGGNLAASSARAARDAGGPAVLGQVLLTPVTDFDFSRPSYIENAEGYVLTRALMRWFADHAIDEKDRADPRIALLRGAHAGLAPALVITAEFDPLRDEGAAFAQALAAAGVACEHIAAPGQVHTSITMVDVIVTGAPYRAAMADAIRRFGRC